MSMTKVRRNDQATTFGVRCFALGTDSRVAAYCVDLDLVVVRPTLDEARCELEHEIVGYLQSVIAHGWLDKIHRPAPPHIFALYYLAVALNRLHAVRERLRIGAVWREQPNLAAAA